MRSTIYELLWRAMVLFKRQTKRTRKQRIPSKNIIIVGKLRTRHAKKIKFFFCRGEFIPPLLLPTLLIVN